MELRIRIVPLIVSGLVALQLTGCALEPLRAPRASALGTSVLKNANLTPVAMGKFAVDARLDQNLDDRIRIRTHPLVTASGLPFSQHLADTIRVELEAAGLYDPKATTIIQGNLTRNEVEIGPFSPGYAALGARFVVVRAGVIRFDREVIAESSWDNAFAGAVAIPTARSQYEVMYRKLVGALFNDSDFRTALSKE